MVSLLIVLYLPNLEVILIFFESFSLISADTFVKKIILLLEKSISPFKASIKYSLPSASFEI